jgi:hypothetical protein
MCQLFSGRVTMTLRQIITSTFLFISLTSFSQANKTFKDTIFNIGDIIKTQDIAYYLDGHPYNNDPAFKEIADFLNTHKNIAVEIGAHSDSRGQADKNYTLTIARAESVKQNLVDRFNVSSTQFVCKGYGESKLLKSDMDISKAKTKEEKENLHQMNRRTEIKIISINGQTSPLLSSRQKYNHDTKIILSRFDSLFIAKDSTLEFRTIGEASKLSNKYILYSKLLLVASEDELLSILNNKTEIPTMRGYAYMAYALKCDKEKRKEKPLSYSFKLHTLKGCLGYTMTFNEFKKYCRERNGYDPNPKKYFVDPEEKKAIKAENKIRKEQGENERKE